MNEIRKELDLRGKVIARKPGVYFITKDNKDKLKRIIQNLTKENLFERYGMAYICEEREDYISLILHEQTKLNI